MNAELTNALTNGIHALCLLIYFVAALRDPWVVGPGFQEDDRAGAGARGIGSDPGAP